MVQSSNFCLLDFPLCPILSGWPGKNLSIKFCSFLSTYELPTFLLRSQIPTSAQSGMKYNPNCQMCHWNPYVYIHNKFGTFLLLLYVNLIIRVARRIQKNIYFFLPYWQKIVDRQIMVNTGQLGLLPRFLWCLVKVQSCLQ